MKKKQRNIYKVLLKNKRVNNYTKLLILLNTLDYYGDNYIPNRKLMNQLGINKPNTIRLLHQLKEDNIINTIYKGRKRYFTFKDYTEEEIKYIDRIELIDYDYLNEEE